MNLKRLREAKDMTQAELAAAAGVAQSAVGNWESGIRMPTADKLPKLAAILGCTIDELFKKEE